MKNRTGRGTEKRTGRGTAKNRTGRGRKEATRENKGRRTEKVVEAEQQRNKCGYSSGSKM